MRKCRDCDALIPETSGKPILLCSDCQKESYKVSNRRRKLKHYYNMTLEDFDLMLQEQKNRCAACGYLPRPDEKRLHVHHDRNHCPGVRSCGRCIISLLCGPCNIAEGAFGGDPERVMALALYLQSQSDSVVSGFGTISLLKDLVCDEDYEIEEDYL